MGIVANKYYIAMKKNKNMYHIVHTCSCTHIPEGISPSLAFSQVEMPDQDQRQQMEAWIRGWRPSLDQVVPNLLNECVHIKYQN